ncbi:unnamed protein product [Fraxinus pennsylvanica]|uniref:Uncharacterized protein n=1 Tax=Fraxinus pennsylvanica TaxID=56036 RepID=A0AAD2A1S6_9LAMI|nr:unnamed protein product [Fraxinus pennsylvanica]
MKKSIASPSVITVILVNLLLPDKTFRHPRAQMIMVIFLSDVHLFVKRRLCSVTIGCIKEYAIVVTWNVLGDPLVCIMYHSLRQVSPSNKRKERDDGPNVVKKPSTFTTKTLAKPSIHRPAKKPVDQPASNNTLLAGYLAHEFLTKSTLFGQPWDPAPAEAVPLSINQKPSPNQKMENEPQAKAEKEDENYLRYMEVSHLLKSDGAHIPGVFNPTQFTRFLQ